jgi:hypothetical protein
MQERWKLSDEAAACRGANTDAQTERRKLEVLFPTDSRSHRLCLKPAVFALLVAPESQADFGEFRGKKREESEPSVKAGGESEEERELPIFRSPFGSFVSP